MIEAGSVIMINDESGRATNVLYVVRIKDKTTVMGHDVVEAVAMLKTVSGVITTNRITIGAGLWPCEHDIVACYVWSHERGPPPTRSKKFDIISPCGELTQYIARVVEKARD